MAVRIPAAGEPAAFGPPLAPSPPDDPLGDLPDGARDQLERMQARDDALFVAGAMAELAALGRRQAAEAESAAFAAEDGLEQAADGFARRLDAGFDAELERVIAEVGALSGPRPSDGALDLLRRRAAGLKSGLGARATVMEDALRRQGQVETIERAASSLRDMVAADADALDEAKARLADLAAAASPLAGRDRAREFAAAGRAALGEAAAGGLIARDPDRALEALRAGAFDADLDDVSRTRLVRAAEGRIEALQHDAERARAAEDSVRVRSRAAEAAAFLGRMERAIGAGEARLANIADAEASGFVSQPQAERLRARIEEHDAAEAERDRAVARIGRALAEDRTLDPADAEDRVAADAYYEAVLSPQIDALPIEERADAIADHAAILGIVPEPAIRRLGGMVMTGPAPQRVAAAGVITRLAGLDVLRDQAAGWAASTRPVRLPGEPAPDPDVAASFPDAARESGNDTGPEFTDIATKLAQLAGALDNGKAINSELPSRIRAVANALEKSDGAALFDQMRLLLPEIDGRVGESRDGREFEIAGRGGAILNALLRKLFQRLFDKKSKPPAPRPGNKPPPREQDGPEGPVLPRVAPSRNDPSESGEEDSGATDVPPGIGHNGAPQQDDKADAKGTGSIEIAPGIRVHGDPRTSLWSRFVGTLKKIPDGPSRRAAEGLVNGGELTTYPRAGKDLSNVTRKGTLADSLAAYRTAIETAGGKGARAQEVKEPDGVRREFQAPDGTRFQHREFSQDGRPTVDIHVIKPGPGKGGRRGPENTIKIRFENE